jgi:hypothetical protein
MSGASYEDGDDLEEYIDSAIAAFEDERNRYFAKQEIAYQQDRGTLGSQPTSAEMASLLDPDIPSTDVFTGRPLAIHLWTQRLVSTLLPAIHDLTSPYTDFPWEHFLAIANHEELRDHVKHELQLRIAYDLYSDLGEKAARCLELAQRVVARRPSTRVLRYIKHLTRSYTAGFLPECVVLCRGVVENAVRDQFREHDVSIPPTSKGQSEMKAMLAYSEQEGWLSKKEANDAWIVWKRGNKAVHEDPSATKDVLGTIELTVTVLTALYGVG